ncbi:MAG: IS3 family transposase [Chlorobiaceae bacterium]
MNESRSRYSKEFKVDAVELLLRSNTIIKARPASLEISADWLDCWKKEYSATKEAAFPGKGHLKTCHRITVCLQKQGFQWSRSRTARLMRSMELRSKVAKKFKVTTNSNQKEPIAQKILDQVLTADSINDAWTNALT